jgi:hypothetical protein
MSSQHSVIGGGLTPIRRVSSIHGMVEFSHRGVEASRVRRVGGQRQSEAWASLAT